MSLRSVHFVLPGGVDDPASAQRRQRLRPADLPRPARLRLAGRKHTVGRATGPGPAPRAARTSPARCGELPDDTVVLLDGLVACGVPEIDRPRGRAAAPRGPRAPAARRRDRARARRRRRARRQGARDAAGRARRDRPPATGPCAGSSPTTDSPPSGCTSPPRAPTSPPSPPAPTASPTCCASPPSPRARGSTGWSRRSPPPPTCPGPACASAGSTQDPEYVAASTGADHAVRARRPVPPRRAAPAPSSTPATPPPT